jgi:hypothetical protein
MRLNAGGLDGSLRQLLLAVIVLDGISLVIDFVDVARYLAGDRKASYVLERD